MDWFRLTAHALVLALATCAAARAAARVNVLGDNVQLSCTQPSTVSLACDFRLLDPAPVENVSAQIHNIALAPPDRSLGNPAFNEFLIYFLVDTSDTIGQPTMAAMLATYSPSLTLQLRTTALVWRRFPMRFKSWSSQAARANLSGRLPRSYR